MPHTAHLRSFRSHGVREDSRSKGARSASEEENGDDKGAADLRIKFQVTGDGVQHSVHDAQCVPCATQAEHRVGLLVLEMMGFRKGQDGTEQREGERRCVRVLRSSGGAGLAATPKASHPTVAALTAQIQQSLKLLHAAQHRPRSNDYGCGGDRLWTHRTCQCLPHPKRTQNGKGSLGGKTTWERVPAPSFQKNPRHHANPPSGTSHDVYNPRKICRAQKDKTDAS